MVKKEKVKKTDLDNKKVEEKCSEKEKGTLAKFIPSAITIAGFCFGLTAIRFALFQRWEYAVMCVFVAALLDAFDGRVARAIGHSSALGAELDSLSDLVCFGVAPAVILFLRSVYLFEDAGWAVCMFFTACCAIRLARFNATLWCGAPQNDIEKRFFTGVPAPAGAMIALLPMTMFFETSKVMFLKPGFITICLIGSGVLMLSTIRTFSTKMMQIDNGSVVKGLIAITLCIICLITDVWLTLSLFTIAYTAAIPMGVFEYHRYYKRRDSENSTSAPQQIEFDASEKKSGDVSNNAEDSMKKNEAFKSEHADTKSGKIHRK